MRACLLLSVLACLGCSAVPRSSSVPQDLELALTGRQVNFLAGLRTHDDPDFGRLDDPIVLAVDYAEPMGLGPLRLEGGLHYTYDEGDGTSMGQDVRLKGRGLEFSAGLNLAQMFGRLRPYVGLGGSLQFVNLRGVSSSGTLFDDDDAAVGGYAKAGLLLQVSQTSHVGVEVRHFVGGDVTLDETDLTLDYDQIVFVFGTSFDWAWPPEFQR